MTDLRTNTPYMNFWDAINQGRAERGLPEALYANVRELWDRTMVITPTEFDCAVRRRASARDMKAGGPFPIAE